MSVAYLLFNIVRLALPFIGMALGYKLGLGWAAFLGGSVPYLVDTSRIIFSAFGGLAGLVLGTGVADALGRMSPPDPHNHLPRPVPRGRDEGQRGRR